MTKLGEVVVAKNLYLHLVCFLMAMTHSELSEKPRRIAGLDVPYPEGFSKRQRIDQALAELTQEQLANIALKFANYRRNIPLSEAAHKVLEANAPPQ